MVNAVSATQWRWQIVLADSEPPIWRRVTVPGAIALADFHRVIQAAMGWPETASYRFRAMGELVDLSIEQPLDQLALVPPASLTYTYDLQEGWLHILHLEAIAPAPENPAPVQCLAGARACPPAGSGGVWGYEELLERLWDPDDPDCHALLAWVGYDFDPDKFDLAAATERLAALTL